MTNSQSHLVFARPHRIPWGPLLAACVMIAFTAWMSLGPVETPVSAEGSPREFDDRVLVSIESSRAEPFTETLTFEGQVNALRQGVVSTDVTGRIDTILVGKGDTVEDDTPIARISIPDLDARLSEARTEIRQFSRELSIARELRRKDLATQDRVLVAETALAQARARLTEIEETRDDTIVRAPFAGALDSLDIEEGEAVTTGQALGRVTDTSILEVSVSVPQWDVEQLILGDPVKVSLATGQVVDGEISYVSRTASDATRTFPVDIRIENPGNRIRSGVSSSVEIKGRRMDAHQVSSAYLSLMEDGSLAVKLLDRTNTVLIQPIEIVGSGVDNVWVHGLDTEVDIITAGQGFVRDGDRVRVKAEARDQ